MARGLVLVLAFFFISGRSMVIVSSAPPCRSVIDQLSPCLPYLTREDNNPASGCCNGVKYLKNYSDKEDRQAICECLESVSSKFAGLDFSLIPSLPKNCGVSIKLPNINSPSFDCSKA
ncbi:hypothetical protein Ddye_002853 [Dipteronia dyeriana]|uniref:Non-specific lipid-transfer protein n=1 Tax=Dipteronia dyeriana TaxID=168575 RepID=A0AAD9XR74_9ROSI|nr:hypothetical protein Ddye_002853 [Dipteronia dyeriana]